MIKDSNIEHSVIKEFLVFSAVSDFSFNITFEPRGCYGTSTIFPITEVSLISIPWKILYLSGFYRTFAKISAICSYVQCVCRWHDCTYIKTQWHWSSEDQHAWAHRSYWLIKQDFFLYYLRFSCCLSDRCWHS